ncbi:hypothetical protein DMC30DRAFT_174316 [Rhodotorula diobovata]|uniref:Hypervirulence associated protein TUDOR domain-containing protein n=1 Tax=Rhodotorula diobovata TaxID=5288 RepID=A0A5C5G0J3_9BASI|nr:hypothetical protein DMC30DRAFT_174316 [Rhodotorula diobovata]
MRSALPPCASRERPAQTKRCSGCRRALRAGSQFPPESRLRDSASLSYAEGTLRVVIRQSVSSRARVADPFEAPVDVRQRSQLVDLPTSKPASLASPLHSDDPLPPNSTDRTKTMTSANDLEKGDKVSWNYGGGQPTGTVEAVVPEHDTIETKGGKEVSRNGTAEDPAVELKADTGVRHGPLVNKAIKLAHELNEVDEGATGSATSHSKAAAGQGQERGAQEGESGTGQEG